MTPWASFAYVAKRSIWFPFVVFVGCVVFISNRLLVFFCVIASKSLVRHNTWLLLVTVIRRDQAVQRWHSLSPQGFQGNKRRRRISSLCDQSVHLGFYFSRRGRRAPGRQQRCLLYLLSHVTTQMQNNFMWFFFFFPSGSFVCLGFFTLCQEKVQQPKPQSVKTLFPSVNKWTRGTRVYTAITHHLENTWEVETIQTHKHTRTHTNIRLGLITDSKARGKVNLSGGLISIPQFKTSYNPVVSPKAGGGESWMVALSFFSFLQTEKKNLHFKRRFWFLNQMSPSLVLVCASPIWCTTSSEDCCCHIVLLQCATFLPRSSFQLLTVASPRTTLSHPVTGHLLFWLNTSGSQLLGATTWSTSPLVHRTCAIFHCRNHFTTTGCIFFCVM